MAGRAKFHFTVGIRDPLASNRVLMPGAGTTALLYPASAPISGAISGAGPYTIPVSHPGELRAGQLCAFVNLSTGELVANGLHTVTSLLEISVTGQWSVTVSGIAVGDVLANPTNYAVIMASPVIRVSGPFAASGSVMSPVNIEDVGLIEGYFIHGADSSELKAVDVYVSGGGLTPGVFARGIPYGGNVLAIDLSDAAAASAGAVVIDDDIGLVELTGTGAAQTFAKARVGRTLNIWTKTASGTISLQTTATASADDQIISPAGASTVPLLQHRLYRLVGVHNGTYTVWSTAEVQGDIDLDSLGNASTGGAVVGDVLYCNSAGGTGSWVAAAAVGNYATGRWASVAMAQQDARFKDQLTAYWFRILAPTGGLTGDTDLRLPSSGVTADTLVTENGVNLLIGGLKSFKDTLLSIQNTAAPTKGMKFDASAVVAGNTRIISMPDRDVNLGNTGAHNIITKTFELRTGVVATGQAVVLNIESLLGITNSILLLRCSSAIVLQRVYMDYMLQSAFGTPSGTLQIYSLSSMPGVGTPPAGATAMLSSGINLATAIPGVGYGVLCDVTSFASFGLVSAGDFLVLAAAVGPIVGTTGIAAINLSLEYRTT